MPVPQTVPPIAYWRILVGTSWPLFSKLVAAKLRERGEVQATLGRGAEGVAVITDCIAVKPAAQHVTAAMRL